jgi:hypothetical protein
MSGLQVAKMSAKYPLILRYYPKTERISGGTPTVKELGLKIIPVICRAYALLQQLRHQQ